LRKFTGKERDAVNENDGLDYFGARYHGSRMGRFLSPDSFSFARPANPQSWNLYAYTLNNPVRFIDPDGHMVWKPTVSPDAYKDSTDSFFGIETNEFFEFRWACPGCVQGARTTQGAQNQAQTQQNQQQSNAPPKSRTDVVLVPSGDPTHATRGAGMMWEMIWRPFEISGDTVIPPGLKFSKLVITLSESENGGPWQSGGKDVGKFHDRMTPETRTVVQRFSVNDGSGPKRVQVILGRDKDGHLIKTWDVKVTIKGVPVYSKP